MMKYMLSILICFISINVFAQNEPLPPYLKDKQLPAFTLFTKDSVAFTETMLAKDKTTIIMLFNPECDHCKEQLQLLVSLPEVQKSAQIVLSTTETLEKLTTFYNTNKLQQYSFVYPVKDSRYILGKFFQPKTVPTVIFYNRKQQFVSIHHGNINKKVVLKQLSK